MELNFTQTDQAYLEREGMNYNVDDDFDPNYVYEMLNQADINQQLRLLNNPQHEECEEMNEEEKHYLLEVMEHEEDENRAAQVRGRNSVLEDADDDDIVN